MMNCDTPDDDDSSRYDFFRFGSGAIEFRQFFDSFGFRKGDKSNLRIKARVESATLFPKFPLVSSIDLPNGSVNARCEKTGKIK
jgi:hypothetical protein